MESLKQLSDDKLLETIQKAKQLKLDHDFICILEGELQRRSLTLSM